MARVGIPLERGYSALRRGVVKVGGGTYKDRIYVLLKNNAGTNLIKYTDDGVTWAFLCNTADSGDLTEQETNGTRIMSCEANSLLLHQSGDNIVLYVVKVLSVIAPWETRFRVTRINGLTGAIEGTKKVYIDKFVNMGGVAIWGITDYFRDPKSGSNRTDFENLGGTDEFISLNYYVCYDWCISPSDGHVVGAFWSNVRGDTEIYPERHGFNAFYKSGWEEWNEEQRPAIIYGYSTAGDPITSVPGDIGLFVSNRYIHFLTVGAFYDRYGQTTSPQKFWMRMVYLVRTVDNASAENMYKKFWKMREVASQVSYGYGPFGYGPFLLCGCVNYVNDGTVSHNPQLGPKDYLPDITFFMENTGSGLNIGSARVYPMESGDISVHVARTIRSYSYSAVHNFQNILASITAEEQSAPFEYNPYGRARVFYYTPYTYAHDLHYVTFTPGRRGDDSSVFVIGMNNNNASAVTNVGESAYYGKNNPNNVFVPNVIFVKNYSRGIVDGHVVDYVYNSDGAYIRADAYQIRVKIWPGWNLIGVPLNDYFVGTSLERLIMRIEAEVGTGNVMEIWYYDPTLKDKYSNSFRKFVFGSGEEGIIPISEINGDKAYFIKISGSLSDTTFNGAYKEIVFNGKPWEMNFIGLKRGHNWISLPKGDYKMVPLLLNNDAIREVQMFEGHTQRFKSGMKFYKEFNDLLPGTGYVVVTDYDCDLAFSGPNW